MNKITAWIQKYKISTHSVVVVVGALILAYSQVPQFSSFVNGIYAHFPAWAKGLVAALLALYMWYRNGEKQIPPQSPAGDGQTHTGA